MFSMKHAIDSQSVFGFSIALELLLNGGTGRNKYSFQLMRMDITGMDITFLIFDGTSFGLMTKVN